MANKTKKRFVCVVQQYQDGDIYLYEKSAITLKAMQNYIDKLRKEIEEEEFEPLEWRLMTPQHGQWIAEDADAHYQIYERKV